MTRKIPPLTPNEINEVEQELRRTPGTDAVMKILGRALELLRRWKFNDAYVRGNQYSLTGHAFSAFY